jgi:hypothetical protein
MTDFLAPISMQLVTFSTWITSTLTTDATYSSKTFVPTYQSHNPENHNMNLHYSNNIKSCKRCTNKSICII